MLDELLPIFYDRQDVTAGDLNQLFAYDDAAWRAHNRAFHGCGIVCGLGVRLEPRDAPEWAVVSPGYALSPTGDEIEVTTEAWVNIDCARPTDETCDEPGFDPAYVVLRPVTRQTNGRLLAPTLCAPRVCTPARVCPGYEVACSPQPPAACLPPFALNECVAERLIHRALVAGDLGDTGLFGCLPSGEETAITLARVVFDADPRTGRPLPPRLVLDDRAYVPALRFLFDLAQLAGTQALKRPWALSPAISFLDEPPVRQLSLNRGIELENLVARGRWLTRVSSVEASTAEVDITGFTRVAEPQASTRGLLGLSVPLATAADSFSLRLNTVDGRVFDTADQPIPIVIDLHDSRLEDIPAVIVNPWRFNTARMRAAGFETAQDVAATKPILFMIRYNQGIFIPAAQMTVAMATLLITHTRAWLRAGAPLDTL